MMTHPVPGWRYRLRADGARKLPEVVADGCVLPDRVRTAAVPGLSAGTSRHGARVRRRCGQAGSGAGAVPYRVADRAVHRGGPRPYPGRPGGLAVRSGGGTASVAGGRLDIGGLGGLDWSRREVVLAGGDLNPDVDGHYLALAVTPSHNCHQGGLVTSVRGADSQR